VINRGNDPPPKIFKDDSGSADIFLQKPMAEACARTQWQILRSEIGGRRHLRSDQKIKEISKIFKIVKIRRTGIPGPSQKRLWVKVVNDVYADLGGLWGRAFLGLERNILARGAGLKTRPSRPQQQELLPGRLKSELIRTCEECDDPTLLGKNPRWRDVLLGRLMNFQSGGGNA